MKLSDVVEDYIEYKRSLGMRFDSGAAVMRSFSRAMGEIPADAVEPVVVLTFLTGAASTITTRWGLKYRILNSFYNYALNRALVQVSPLPLKTPTMPPTLIPYIYSADELDRLVVTAGNVKAPRSALQPETMQCLLLLLYGSGMRVGEALALKKRDVNVQERLIEIRDTKFFKSRLVPIGPRLATALDGYLSGCRMRILADDQESAFLLGKNGDHVKYNAVNTRFCQIRLLAEVIRDSSARYQPRIHDIRHTAAVHRLTAWYREGADVQRLLPQLATYLGHVDIQSTQYYLTMTPELLRQASLRYERYAQPEGYHE